MYAECSFLWGLEVQTNQIIFCHLRKKIHYHLPNMLLLEIHRFTEQCYGYV